MVVIMDVYTGEKNLRRRRTYYMESVTFGHFEAKEVCSKSDFTQV